MNITELISKYLQKTSSVDENALLMEWVISSEDNTKEFASICRYWYTSGKKQNQTKFDSHAAFTQFQQVISKSVQQTTKSRTIKSYWKQMSVAAAVIILFVSSLFIFQNKEDIILHSVSNQEQAILEITLPDSSIVYLHQDAHITYPSKFDSDSRNIEINGHVFCSVQKNTNAPFIVKNQDISIQVLGTKFDVNNSSVIVAEGSVQVFSNTNKESVILEKNERADLSKNGEITKSKNNDINFMSWQTGILTFNRTPLLTVFADIERHYNCSIIVSNKEIYTEILTGTYQNHKLQEILEVICAAFPNLSYTQTENTITFQK